jgi:hypothetical protein
MILVAQHSLIGLEGLLAIAGLTERPVGHGKVLYMARQLVVLIGRA